MAFEMSHTASNSYLSAEVMTATPQRLRLMLIDGAMRFARRALEHWDDPAQREVRFEAVERCRRIITELFAAVQQDGSEVNRQVAGIYLYLFRTLSEGSLTNDRQKLEDVLSVLAEERTTWQQVCQQMPLTPVPDGSRDLSEKEITAKGVVPISPHHIDHNPTSSLSLEG
jgi:flagellar protein FliS